MASEVEMEFKLNKNFWTDINNPSKFTLNNISSDVYSFLVCSEVPTDIYDITYQTKDGVTNEDVLGTLKLPGEVNNWQLLNINENIPRIKLKTTILQNGGFVISMDNNVDTMIELGDSVSNRVQGLILYNNNTNYMLAYATLPYAINVENRIRIPYNGAIAGINICSRMLNQSEINADYNDLLEENNRLKELLSELDDYI